MISVDLTDTLKAIEVARQVAVDLDGAEVPERAAGRSRSAEIARLNKELLRLAHLLDVARIEAMNAYYDVRTRDEQ